MSTTTESIRILHVDDDPEFAEVTATFLEREDSRFSVETATSAGDGLEHLAGTHVDCIVSDHDMPGQNGLAFLESVREDYPDLPFILFTGKGSEAVASDAISAGVTDYLQKETGTDQYAVLANRIDNSVEKYRAVRARERNRVLVEEATDAILVVDSEATIEYATPSSESVLGRTPDELVGTSGFEPIHPDDRDRVTEAFAALVEQPGGRRTVEFRYERPDGSWIWVETRGRNLLESTAVDGIAIYTRDITDRKEREREREAMNERLTTVVSNVPIVLFAMDGEGVFTLSEGRSLSKLGLDPGEIVGESVFDVYGEHEGIVENAERALSGESVQSVHEVQELFFDTTYRPVVGDETGEVTSVIGVATDITERKERERELTALRDRMEFALDTTDSVIYEVDHETRTETRHGPFERIYGVPEDAAGTIEAFYDRAVHPDDRETVASRQTEVIRHRSDSTEVEYRTHPDAGDVRWIRSSMASVDKESKREPERLIGLATDVTGLKEREAELERQNERLETFASVVSHDLRNPLNVAEGRLELAMEECASEDLNAVVQAHGRMRALIQDLLTLAREGEHVSAAEPVALADTVEWCWQNVETAAATLVTGTEREIRADRSRLQRLLENLIRNAVEHGGADVTVTVGGLADGFYVADDGPGIPEDEREEVFGVGYSTTERGTGLGLAIVQELADAHGWDVAVTDSEAGGARVEVTGVEFV